MPISWPRRIAMSVVAVVIIYGNLSMVFTPQKLGLPQAMALPRPFWMQDLFLLTGMFTSYADHAADFVLGGRTVPQRAGQKPQWVVLDLDEHIPGRLGIQFTQMLVARHWDTFGKLGQELGWRMMATQIRARHNRLHPDHPIDAVSLGAVTWPLSPDGYRANKSLDNRNYQDWYSDEKYEQRAQ